MRTLEEFSSLSGILFDKDMKYFSGSNNRKELAKSVLDTGTEPPHLVLDHHVEMGYASVFPERIAFGCIHPAASRGETFITDNYLVTHNMDKAFRQRLEAQGMLSIRNYTNAAHPINKENYFKHWQEAFFTNSAEEVEDLCKSMGFKTIWDEHQNLRTENVIDAFECHPKENDGRKYLVPPIIGNHCWFDEWKPFCDWDQDDRPFNTKYVPYHQKQIASQNTDRQP